MKHVLIAVIIGLFVTACDDPGELGMELLPNTDLISVNSLVDANNSAFTYLEDSLRTDETSKNLLGSIIDPVFGKTTIDMACQYRLTYYPDFQEDAVADSIFLYLFYKDFYGDTITPQHLKIYELDQPLSDTEKYYQDEDLSSYKKDNVLAEYEFIPKRTVTVDSTSGKLDTLYQTLKIPLDMELAERFISADSTQIWDIESYFDFFKGLYFGVEDVDQNGTIITMEMLSNDYVNGSAVLIYYHETNAETGEQDTLSVPLVVSSLDVRVNSYKHEYSGSQINGLIDNEQIVSENLYIQSTGGLRSKIYIPGLDFWKDSVNIAINKAELVFQVDTIASDILNFEPPARLLLTFINDDGQEYLPVDYSFSTTYYGGTLETSDYTYRFNIAQQMQRIIKGEFGNNGFYLGTANKNSEFRRVVLKGSGEAGGIKLNIAYSKVLQ
ncbi:MAG: DUF4270 domain-containing protein [Prolixibacteraceae bacterium]|nr:DUF4270 domain-containing protein [Prolixibacteraceae bacterium]